VFIFRPELEVLLNRGDVRDHGIYVGIGLGTEYAVPETENVQEGRDAHGQVL
jgi:hypothetical protein